MVIQNNGRHRRGRAAPETDKIREGVKTTVKIMRISTIQADKTQQETNSKNTNTILIVILMKITVH